MTESNKVFGPNKEMNDKARAKIFKIYANGIFHIKIPVDPKDVPEEELEYIKQQKVK